MAAKGKQIQSTSSYMVPHQPSHDSSDHEPFLDDEIGELQLDSSTGVEGQPADKHMVQVRNNEGEVKEILMEVSDINYLPPGDKVVIPFDGNQPSTKDANWLLGVFLGPVAINHSFLPISFKCWPHVPKDYKDRVWDEIIKSKLWWDPVHDGAARAYVMKDLGKKWKEHRLRLYNEHYDVTKTRDENIRFPPKGIAATQWASFIGYRLEEKTKAICQQNSKNRAKLAMNHTDGSTKLKRKRAEIEKVSEIEKHGTAPKEISRDDSPDQVFVREHQGVGDGFFPTRVFGSKYHCFCGTSSSFNNTTLESRIAHLENEIQELKTKSKTRDENLKKMEMLLVQLLMNASLPIPSFLATSLDDAKTSDDDAST